MKFLLKEVEIRVLGCLIEKQKQTPEYYPLTLNALVNACNQKSSRDPVMDLEDADVARALESLKMKDLAMMRSDFSSRVPKYEHHLAKEFNLSPGQISALCILFLRGPQTPGEVKTRTARMFAFSNVVEVEEVLYSLINFEPDALVAKLPKEPGRKECRYAHLFSGEPQISTAVWEPPTEKAVIKVRVEEERIKSLEARFDEVQAELQALKSEFAEFKKQFD